MTTPVINPILARKSFITHADGWYFGPHLMKMFQNTIGENRIKLVGRNFNGTSTANNFCTGFVALNYHTLFHES